MHLVEIFLEELNLSLSSQDETCRFAVIECITGASFQSAQLEMHLLPRLIPWFLFESKPSANWRFLHLISGWLKRLEQNIHSSIHEKQTLLHDWERNMFQKKESMKSIPEMNVYPLQLADLEEQIYRHFLYNMITFEVNSFRQHNASTLLNQWMFVCLEKESILSHVSRKLTQQLLYSCYISMLNGSEKLVKSVSKFLDIQKLSSPDTLSSLDWIWKVSFRHLSSIRSSHAECGAQIIRILFKNYVISMGYYLTAWKNDDSVTSEQLDFGMTQFRITDPALASFYFFSWFLSNIKAKFSSSIVVFSELNEEEWLFGHFIAYKHLFQDGWRLEQWLNFYSLEDIRTNILNPLMDILSIYIMESLKGVGYMEPWIGVYLHSIASSSTTESIENDSSFQRKLIVGSFHCLKEICSLISAIIQTVCGHDVADAGNNRKPQPSYVTKGSIVSFFIGGSI